LMCGGRYIARNFELGDIWKIIAQFQQSWLATPKVF